MYQCYCIGTKKESIALGKNSRLTTGFPFTLLIISMSADRRDVLREAPQEGVVRQARGGGMLGAVGHYHQRGTAAQ